MSLLAPHIRMEIEKALQGIAGQEMPAHLDVKGRRIFLFTGEHAEQKADTAHENYFKEGKAALSGIESYGKAWYFVA